jgi:peptidoglycan/xylan/chitin deacetylase (PgdA/CDA1 family)
MYKLTVLTYHKFTEQDNDYVFSRTYKQFANDLIQKDFDWITMDDGHNSIIKACAMMREKNFRAKVFISTNLIGEQGYCTEEEIWKLSRFHYIESHSHEHKKLTELSFEEVLQNITESVKIIKAITGRIPRYFAAPWNQFNREIEYLINSNGMQLMKHRIDIKNISR